MTQHKIIGATIRATNRTHGLAPARDWGGPETVTEVVNEHDMTIATAEGNTYLNGDYRIMAYPQEEAAPGPDMRELVHYFDDCGGEVGDDDIFAAEPWGITCPNCLAALGPEAGERG